MDGVPCGSLGFADDIVIVADSRKELVRQLADLQSKRAASGYVLELDKVELSSTCAQSARVPLKVPGFAEEIKGADPRGGFVILGHEIAMNRDMSIPLEAAVARSWQRMSADGVKKWSLSALECMLCWAQHAAAEGRSSASPLGAALRWECILLRKVRKALDVWEAESHVPGRPCRWEQLVFSFSQARHEPDWQAWVASRSRDGWRLLAPTFAAWVEDNEGITLAELGIP